MNQLMRLALSVLIATTLMVGCQRESTPKGYSEADLVGTWQGDFELSWKKSKADFLADTLRGEDAYPKDPAEKAKVVRKELEPVITGMIYEIKDNGTFKVDVAGSKSEGTYTIDKKGDAQMGIVFQAEADPMMKDSKGKKIETKMEITFVSKQTIEIVYNDVAIVFKKK